MTGPMYRQPGHPDVVRRGRMVCPCCHKTVDYEVDALGRVTLREPTERERCITDHAEHIAALRKFHRGSALIANEERA